jgi:uncharacterized protein (DUF983 family)
MSTPYIFELILSVMIYSLLSSFELIERNTQMNSYLLVILLLCFAFVGVARVAQPDLIAQTFTGFFKVKRPDSNGFEGSKLQPSMTALIILNYVVSFSTCVFLFLYQQSNMPETVWLTIKIVFALTFLQLINFRLVFILSGERAILDSMSAVNKQIWSFGGFILTCMALLWILNQELQHVFEQLFFIVLSSLIVWRIVKGLLLAAQLRYKWYYLILYLCTLEILPLLILSKLAWPNFLAVT